MGLIYTDKNYFIIKNPCKSAEGLRLISFSERQSEA
jgi:hypothetical protein